MTPVTPPRTAVTFDMKFEVAIIPASDIDRAKRFYQDLGWRLDADFVRPDGSRAVQLTPPGSPSSIQLGSGSAASFYLVVAASAAPIRNAAVTRRSSRSTTPMVTTGWCRRLPNDCPGA
jgi:hypothetical protein